jgi:hypothetical protein
MDDELEPDAVLIPIDYDPWAGTGLAPDHLLPWIHCQIGGADLGGMLKALRHGGGT